MGTGTKSRLPGLSVNNERAFPVTAWPSARSAVIAR